MIDGLSNFVRFTVQVQKRDFRNRHKRVQKHRQQFVGTQFTQAEKDLKRCSRCKITKIEVLDEKSPNTPNGADSGKPDGSTYPLANLLKGIEKSYDPGKFLLGESEISPTDQTNPQQSATESAPVRQRRRTFDETAKPQDTESTSTYALSNEVDEFNVPFILSSDGTTIFGNIDNESKLTEAPIKLSLGENHVDKNGVNHGYGLLHIEADHGKQIRTADFNSVEEFVEKVARDYNKIRLGNNDAGKQTYLLEISDKHNNTLFIQLSRNGKYWNVNSAGIFKKKYSRNKQEIFTRPALGPGTNTDSSGVNSGRSEGVTAPAGNSPQDFTHKDTQKSPTGQTNSKQSVKRVFRPSHPAPPTLTPSVSLQNAPSATFTTTGTKKYRPHGKHGPI